MKSAPNSSLRILLQTLGFISLALGFAGAFLPLLPTTPFILLSAWCFAKSSPRWHDYIHTHREFGPLIFNWKTNRSIALKHKVVASSMVLISIAGILFSDRPEPLKFGLATGLGVILAGLLLVKTAARPK